MKNKLLLALLILPIHMALSQTIVTGQVVEDNVPVAGVNILIQGETEGTVTDFNGSFRLETLISPPFTLIVSYLGYQTIEISISNSTNLGVISISDETIFEPTEEIYDPDDEILDSDDRSGTVQQTSGLTEFPWSVSLKIPINENYVECGGVLIGNRWVLTSAHCFQDRENSYYYAENRYDVYYGSMDHTQTKSVQIEKIYYPRGDLAYDIKTLKNDIVLLKLKNRVRSTNKYKTDFVSLLSAEELVAAIDENDFVAVGWGATKNQPTPKKLQKVTKSLTSYEDCKKIEKMKNILQSSMMCFGKSPENIFCMGDSGNGVYIKVNEEVKLVGLISLGSDCSDDFSHNNTFSTLTNVVPFREWINKTISAN